HFLPNQLFTVINYSDQVGHSQQNKNNPRRLPSAKQQGKEWNCNRTDILNSCLGHAAKHGTQKVKYPGRWRRQEVKGLVEDIIFSESREYLPWLAEYNPQYSVCMVAIRPCCACSEQL